MSALRQERPLRLEVCNHLKAHATGSHLLTVVIPIGRVVTDVRHVIGDGGNAARWSFQRHNGPAFAIGLPMMQL